MSTKITPALEPFLALPSDGSLIVMTGVVGTTTNWLTLRYLQSFLGQQAQRSTYQDTAPILDSKNEDASVLLVSFMRDYAFWRDGASRLGVDLDHMGQQGQFRFADGLSYLCLPGTEPSDNDPKDPKLRWVTMLTSHHYRDLRVTLLSELAFLRALRPSSKIVLIIDQLDLALAMLGRTTVEVGTHVRVLGLGVGMHELVLDLREKADATIMTFAVDEPLLNSPRTPLETDHRDLVCWTVHRAELHFCLTPLKTGAAKDVSGLLLINDGGRESSRPFQQHKYLYHVAGDGSVGVFERGGQEPGDLLG